VDCWLWVKKKKRREGFEHHASLVVSEFRHFSWLLFALSHNWRALLNFYVRCIYISTRNLIRPLPFQFPYEDMLMAHHLEKRWKRLFLSALYRYEKLQPIKQKFADMTSVEIDEFCDDVSCRRKRKYSEVEVLPLGCWVVANRIRTPVEAVAALPTLHFRYFAFFLCISVLFPPIIISFQWHFNWIFPRAQPLLSIVSGDGAAVVSVKWINLKCLSFELERKTDVVVDGSGVGRRGSGPAPQPLYAALTFFPFRPTVGRVYQGLRWEWPRFCGCRTGARSAPNGSLWPENCRTRVETRGVGQCRATIRYGHGGLPWVCEGANRVRGAAAGGFFHYILIHKIISKRPPFTFSFTDSTRHRNSLARAGARPCGPIWIPTYWPRALRAIWRSSGNWPRR